MKPIHDKILISLSLLNNQKYYKVTTVPIKNLNEAEYILSIIHKEGFLIEEEYEWLVNFFGKENCFHISKDEMYYMNSNVFSISPEVVISEKNFTRLNTWLRNEGFTVEEVPYAEIAKQEGLLRCSTMPLIRD